MTAGSPENPLHFGEFRRSSLALDPRTPADSIGQRQYHQTPHLRLRQDCGEANEDIVHYRHRDGFETPSVPGIQVKDARPIAADYSDGSGASISKRHRKPAAVREASSPGDGQHDGCPGELIEGSRGDDHDRPGLLFFMGGGGVEGDQPALAALYYSSSLPTGLTSSQPRSPSLTGAVSSHCARSSSTLWLGHLLGTTIRRPSLNPDIHLGTGPKLQQIKQRRGHCEHDGSAYLASAYVA